MIRIEKAKLEHSTLLSDLAKRAFVESHHTSAAREDIDYYIAWKLTKPTFDEELADSRNIFYLLYYKEQLAGYSKIIYNQPIEAVEAQGVAKLERIYFLKDFHGQQLGLKLLEFNLDLAKKVKQTGVWLYTWTGNYRAVAFYQKLGFEIIGHGDFKISETHYNPNHLMFLDLHE